MKRRYLYLLLFGVPILFAATVIAFALFGAAAGVLWLFVAGDNPWPSVADTFLAAVFVVAFAASSLALAYQAYTVGRQQEVRGSLDGRHVLAAVGVALLLLLSIGFYQWRVGNIGPRSDTLLCSEFCRGQGFAGSGMPPRDAGAAACSCYDAQGREVVKVPMESVAPRR